MANMIVDTEAAAGVRRSLLARISGYLNAPAFIKRMRSGTKNSRSFVYYYYRMGRNAENRRKTPSRSHTRRRATLPQEVKMTSQSTYVDPPSKFLLAIEGRALWEFGAFFMSYPLLCTAPRGDGHPVLVLPGLAASDVSTEALRTYLKDLGYAPHGWELGRNLGHHHTVEGEMLDRLNELHRRYGRKVSVIGWSLGGVFARELAKAMPDAVRLVISLGSPITGCPRSTNAWRLYEVASGQRVGRVCRQDGEGEAGCAVDCGPVCGRGRRHPPVVPSTSIFSRTDGVVAWQCSLEVEGENNENIEIEGSHCGLGHNPLALYAIADRLAQPEGAWVPFDRGGWRALFYPNPKRGLSRAA